MPKIGALILGLLILIGVLALFIPIGIEAMAESGADANVTSNAIGKPLNDVLVIIMYIGGVFAVLGVIAGGAIAIFRR